MSPREEEEAKEVSVSLHLNLALAYQFVIMDYCKRQKTILGRVISIQLIELIM